MLCNILMEVPPLTNHRFWITFHQLPSYLPVLSIKVALSPKKTYPQLHAAIGQLNWLATIMPQPLISFEVYQASSQVKAATIADIIHINKVTSKVQQQQSYLHFNRLDLSTMHIRVYMDASFNNLPDGGSLEGNIPFLADAWNSCCPTSWTPNRANRVVGSPLAAETLSLNDGIDSAF